MTNVTRDELLDTMQEAQLEFNRAIDKLDLRVEQEAHRAAQKGARAAIMSKEFQQVQESIDDIKDDLKELRQIVLQMGKQVQRMWATVEELSLGSELFNDDSLSEAA